MSTTATRKQAEAIRREMQSIRNDLPYSMDDARHELKQFSDWKYYVRKLPLTSFALTAVVAYKLVPKGQAKHASRGVTRKDMDQVEEKTFWSSLIGTAAAMAMRAGTSLAVSQASKWLSNRHASNEEPFIRQPPVPR